MQYLHWDFVCVCVNHTLLLFQCFELVFEGVFRDMDVKLKGNAVLQHYSGWKHCHYRLSYCFFSVFHGSRLESQCYVFSETLPLNSQ